MQRPNFRPFISNGLPSPRHKQQEKAIQSHEVRHLVLGISPLDAQISQNRQNPRIPEK
jgi:hypothetical protein